MTRLFVPDRRIILAPAIWPKGRTIEAEVALPPVRFQGWVTAELIHARTGLVKQRLSFPNLIVDAGLDVIGSGSVARALYAIGSSGYIGVGTSATAPAVGQTGLIAEVARVQATGGIAEVSGSGPSFAYWYNRHTRLFTEAQGNGVLAELGCFWNAAGGTMWARQLFKDAGGVPTTITKTSADQLRITWENRFYSPTVDASGTIAISGTNYDWVSRACEIDQSMWSFNQYYGWYWAWNSGAAAGDTQTLGAVTASPSNTQNAAQSGATASVYVAGSLTRDIEFVWEPGVANFTGGGIGNIVHGPSESTYGGPRFQTSFTPKFAKDSTKRLKVTFRYSWARL